MIRFGSAPARMSARDPMGERVGLAGAGAGDDQQRRRAARFADPVLDRAPLRLVQLDGGFFANQGERHGPDATSFALCSQARRKPSYARRRRVPARGAYFPKSFDMSSTSSVRTGSSGKAEGLGAEKSSFERSTLRIRRSYIVQ